jgi:excinuclease ABC subunit B
LKKLEQQMQHHAKNLEFEAAANVRDKLSEIKQRFFTAH